MDLPATTRRQAMSGAVAVSIAALAAGAPFEAHSEPTKPSAQFDTAWAELVQGRPLATGRIKLDIPRLAESGNSVSLKVTVDAPMTEADHVRLIHILSEQNPIATIGRFHLSPRSGLGEVETSIRLATTQNVRVVAEMSDGSLQTTSAEVVVLIAACLDPG